MRLRLTAMLVFVAVGTGADTVSSRVDMYDDGAVTVVMPVVAAEVEGPRWTVALATSVDALSGATPLLSVDGVSGATTFDEVRGAGSASFTHHPSKTRSTTATVSWSSESDDATQSLSVGGTTELFDRTATLSATGSGGRRTTTTAGGGAPIDHSTSAGVDVTWSQILTRSMVVDLQLTGRHDACGPNYGCNANPYRQVPLVAGHLVTTVGEHHPNTRSRVATGIRLALALGDRTALHVGLRGYTDTWQMPGATGSVKIARALADDRLLLKARIRASTQAPATFYLDDYTTPPDVPTAPMWRTADRELSGARNVALGGSAGWTFDNVGPFLHLGVTARVMRMWFAYPDYTELPRRRAWVVGGGFHAEL